MDNESTDTRRRAGRSPRYPGIDLRTAIEKARALYKSEGKNAAPHEVVVSHWGYSPKSSSGMVAMGAMRSFGLIESVGKSFKLSDLALDIVLDERPDSPERDRAIQRAALMPKIHQEIWNKYGGNLPSDATLKYNLTRDLGFTDSGAEEFIKQFRATLAYANPRSGDNLPEAEGDENPGSDEGEPSQGHHALRSPMVKPPARRPEMNQDVFTLSEGDVVLQWPATLSPESFEDFKDWLRLIERKAGRAVRAPDGPDAE